MAWTSLNAQQTLVPEASITQIQVLDVQQNLRQTAYHCGAYTVATLLDAVGDDVSAADVIEINQRYEIPNLGVVPEVLVSTLEHYNRDAMARTLRWQSDEEKIATLKALMQQEYGLIVLVRRHGYLHYVLLTGYEGEQVHLYDPLLERESGNLTIDRNGEWSGNDVMAFFELVEIWNEVSVLGLYENMMVATK